MQAVETQKNLSAEKNEINNSFKGNLVDNHLVRVLSSLLKGYIRFVVEVPFENQSEI